DFDRVFGLGLEGLVQASAEVPEEVQKLVDERQAARHAKDWARSDRLRERIAELGYLVEDTPDGARVKPK
ncbi:MAG: cysteine--tRNA ligase, partial [candidate division WOR-3 bacterium]